jgi:hypothetical protein
MNVADIWFISHFQECLGRAGAFASIALLGCPSQGGIHGRFCQNYHAAFSSEVLDPAGAGARDI